MNDDEMDTLDEELELSFLGENNNTISEEEILNPLEGSFVEVPVSSDDNVYECGICEKKFKIKNSLKRHLKTHATETETQPVICEECGKSFSCKRSLRVHKGMLHGEDKEATGIKQCPYQDCDKIFPTKQLLQDHINNHMGTKAYKCKKCDREYVRKYERNRHQRVCGSHLMSTLECNVCNKQFAKPANLSVHKAVHESKVFTCENCDKTFKYITGLYKHRRKKHHK